MTTGSKLFPLSLKDIFPLVSVESGPNITLFKALTCMPVPAKSLVNFSAI